MLSSGVSTFCFGSFVRCTWPVFTFCAENNSDCHQPAFSSARDLCFLWPWCPFFFSQKTFNTLEEGWRFCIYCPSPAVVLWNWQWLCNTSTERDMSMSNDIPFQTPNMRRTCETTLRSRSETNNDTFRRSHMPNRNIPHTEGGKTAVAIATGVIRGHDKWRTVRLRRPH